MTVPHCSLLLVASATGFSFDFAVLNPLGFFFYTIYAILLRHDPVVRKEYAKRNGGHEPQVSLADVGFASHALLLSSIALVQASTACSVTEMAEVTDKS